jgi:CheY-like chemotaxis protein
MFSSKIKTTATHLGVPVVFARSADSAIAGMRSERPAIVILDLNNKRIDPLGIVATMKDDATLKDIPAVGFVSHVDAGTIEAARRAGIEVLARSAFTERLPEILARGK